jgi:replicative DNA helicase Mcm
MTDITLDEETLVATYILDKCPDYEEVLNTFPYKKSIVVDYRKMVTSSSAGLKLAEKLIADPRYTIATLENALFEMVRTVKGDTFANDVIKDTKFRFINVPTKKRIRLIRANDVNTFISFEGICRLASPVKPKITIAMFRCSHCGNLVRQPQRTRKLEYPEVQECNHCHSSTKWIHDIERDTFQNVQYAAVQEYHEGLKSAEQPYSINVELTDDLCGVINAGYRTTINGILRVVEGKGKTLVVDTIIDANMVELGDQTYTDIVINDEDIEKIKTLAALPNIHEIIGGAIAPSIYGHDIVKTALGLQLFGGVTRTEKGSRIRGDIHVLLFGDPGIAKSQLLDFVSMVSPRGVKAMGGQSTGAGLTCAAKQDGSGEWALEGGALVLADGGLCCIDEFEKMDKDERASIHGAMEQQKIDVNKAGINATLMTRCSILAAANPKSGRWDPYGNIGEQIDLPPSLLSRFDLIFILRDIPDGRADTHIADHILEGSEEVERISLPLLRKYIAYARRSVNPKRSKEANIVIKDFYLKLRGLGRDGTVPITPRKLEDLKRLAEASARIRLSPNVEELDAKIAVQLVDACLRDVAYDSKTGKFDIDRVICNTSAAQRSHIALIKNSLQCNQSRMSRVAIYASLMEHLNKQEIDIALDRMQENCWIVISRDDEIRLL